MDFSVYCRQKMTENVSDLRQAAEKSVLTYLIALGYDQKPRQLILERGLTFTPLPPDLINESDPAAFSNVIVIDFNNMDVSVSNANFLATMTGKNFTSDLTVNKW